MSAWKSVEIQVACPLCGREVFIEASRRHGYANDELRLPTHQNLDPIITPQPECEASRQWLKLTVNQ